jgi:hypothetical protein
MRKNLFLLAILAFLFSLVASAQNIGATSGIDEQTTLQAHLTDETANPDVLPPVPPPYCNPCVFYSGDFKAKPFNTKQPNGLFNETFHTPNGDRVGQVWVPFSVKKKIVVQGLFVNELFVIAPPSPAIAKWEIRNGVSLHNGGEVQCSGSGMATANPTGRTFTFANVTYTEYTYLLPIPQAEYCVLTNPGAMLPQLEGGDPPTGGHGQCPPNCVVSVTTEDSGTAAGAAPLSFNLAYLSDVPQPFAPHHFGLPNIYNKSFFSSNAGDNFEPATTVCAGGPPKAITTVGCHMFSVGIIGTGR